jgi:hypothetical protein
MIAIRCMIQEDTFYVLMFSLSVIFIILEQIFVKLKI